MKAKEFLDKGIENYEKTKDGYQAMRDNLDKIIYRSADLIKANDIDLIDQMTELSVDFWLQIYLMKPRLSPMKPDANVMVLKYKRMCLKDGEDKRDLIDKVGLIRDSYFTEIESWSDELRFAGTLLTMLREKIRSLTGDKRAAEHMGV